MNLPNPKRDRWQPLRGGLMNLYYFDHLRLRYEDGRLLLRGNNGTGKSRILALQLPFLLDGEISPSRVEPDGDPSKRIEWHLLLDGRYEDRVGYSWLEFGRLDEDGTPLFKTIGCGMKAVAGKGPPTRWYFVTDRRVDAELQLASKAKVPLTRQALQDAIGERGRVFEKPSEYRVAVDHALFGLGEQRYAALLDLLIQLRRPQLSRKLDERLLSDALSQALPPLSERTIADVAEAFRSLETDRHELEQNRSALTSIQTFQKVYRRYVQAATRKRAEVVRREHAEYERNQRRLREAREDLDGASQELGQLGEALRERELEHGRAEAAIRELELDPTQRDTRRLAEAREQAERARDEATRAKDHEARSRLQLERAIEATSKVRAEVDAGRSVLAEAREVGDALARKVGLDGLLVDLDEVRVGRRLDERERQARHLRGLADERAAKHEVFERARRMAEYARSELDRASEACTTKRGERDRLRDELEAALVVWLDALELLELPQTDALFEAILDWSEQGEGEGPILEAVAVAHAAAVATIAAHATELEIRRRALREQLDALEAERDELSRGVHRLPRAPDWRDDTSRIGRDGAPLWALCDFQSHVGGEHRGAYEAALEASGMLDAWVTPEGRLLDRDHADVCLVATEPIEHSLAAILEPAIDEAAPHAGRVDRAIVARILASIGSEPSASAVWVADDGRFALGPLLGRARKQAAQYIGHGAREQARRQRLELLANQIDEIQAGLAELEQAIAACDERRRDAERERNTAPRGTTLRDAVRELVAAEREQARRARDFRAASEEQEAAAVELQRSEDALRADAEQLGLATWIDSLALLDKTLEQLRSALTKVWSEKRHVDSLESRLHDLQGAEQQRREELMEARERSLETDARAGQLAAAHAALHEAIGAKVDELERKLRELRRQSKTAEQHLKQLGDRRRQADQRLGAAGKAEEECRSQLVMSEGRRSESIDELQALARTGILANLDEAWRERDVSVAWSPSAAIEIARDLEKQLQSVDIEQAAWERLMSTLQRELQGLTTALSAHGLNPTTTQKAEVFVVTIVYQGRALDPSGLAQTIADEIASRERILDERERAILENHLIVEIASHLHERIRNGERLVSEMNREIESRPLSTGMRFRFKWAPRSEPGLEPTRKRLLAAQGVWSPADRQAIGGFLQQRIQDERARSETGTWVEHLGRALDYRMWHEFQIERMQNQTWTRLTRRTYGTGSGGEKAIALTLPQLAAAAAHYGSASRFAPRLILMDEAFVGVDSDMRAKCMGLLAAFDLDFVMTSEREWGCYDTLPALAIYQLVTRPGLDAVHETRWVWNGRQRIRDSDDTGRVAS